MGRDVKGLRDWAIQRVTAIYMAIYIIGAVVCFALYMPIQYQMWQACFHTLWVQVASIIFLICLLWHAWIGVWTVLTDYVKVPVLLIVLELIIILALIVFLLWGIQILWHI